MVVESMRLHRSSPPVVDIIFFLVAVLGVWKTGQYVSAFIEDQCFLETQRGALREKFERWWISVAETKPRYFAVSLAHGACAGLSAFFGKRLFSKKSFFRSTILATGCLVASIALTSMFSHSGIGVKPWKEYERTIEVMKATIERAQARKNNSKEDKELAEAARIQKILVERYGTRAWKIFYS